MKIIPRGKYILVKRDEAKSLVSEHGISAPSQTEAEEKAFGTVIDFGDKVEDPRMKKGERVMYGAYAGEEIEIDEKGKKVKYRLLEDEFVIAFIK